MARYDGGRRRRNLRMIYAAFLWSHTQEREEVLFKEGEALEEGKGEKKSVLAVANSPSDEF